MKCLHICNDLLGSKVHENLYNHLERDNFEQTIYYPSRKELSEKQYDSLIKIKATVIVSKPLKKIHRLLFKSKIQHLYEDLINQVDLSRFDIVHATTLFSDGALALRIFEEFKIPYVIAIRGTDVNLFLRFRKDLRPLAKKIILHASQIVFISDSLKFNFFQNKYINSLGDYVQTKSRIIPNGIDSYWLDHLKPKKEIKPYKIIYVGKFNRNKNVLNLIEAFLNLKKTLPLLELHLVGGGGNQEKKIKKYINSHPMAIYSHGSIYNKNELEKIISSNHIFAMASIGETFGLVYLEALTQGLPILFTKNQGIDGTFKENVGVSVAPKSIISIEQGLNKIINEYSQFEIEAIDFSKFSWPKISDSYIKLYQSIL